ncbi:MULTISPECIES: GlxA family transcriptional regulator [unclassified Novosphingobium]|uniref:GlxA family transcriptional regulator n=1 Tax=unclassified Novosphingobium TaxID=2644732 RepID=UPI0006B8A65F|nr:MULTISPECIES: GlxA family transcriptional regulator [unclassified Novosphingobium]KPF55800.1 AraC family transcriptional regulator [Novosphingobium sp. AAP1]PTR06687.1 AraC family transcriptional regulator with amidase-like domain [Novosphingobium sp. GV055]PUA94980.1 AraC family transcriptional regulator with amidase-like domain [Novosphingobium sp. GV061]PUB14108.1 AraC family transcriptional regulator with amidase-like domain [Novosphingobium sp. GV079]PUB38682.1 AraC family transcriptio
MPHVSMVLTPGFQFLALGVQAAFELANVVQEEPYYTLSIASVAGGEVLSSSGFAVPTVPLAQVGPVDTLLLLAGLVPPPRQDEATLETLRTMAREARRVAGLCTGAFLLGQIGLLDGRRATTHWAFARQMREDFPNVRVEDDRIFINEGSVWTSAGLTAGLDLAIALIEKDLGRDVAGAIARRLVMHHRRAGGQSQHSELLELAPSSDRIQKAVIFARAHLANPLTVEELAEIAALSPRQFARAFRAETGQTPAKAVEQIRLEAARLMIEETRHPMDQVARECGFVDIRRMREAFMRQYGQPPQTVRRLAKAA